MYELVLNHDSIVVVGGGLEMGERTKHALRTQLVASRFPSKPLFPLVAVDRLGQGTLITSIKFTNDMF